MAEVKLPSDECHWTSHDKSRLVQVMALCHQTRCHYLSQCWPSSMSPYGIPRHKELPIWQQEPMMVKILITGSQLVNSSPPGESSQKFADSIFKCISMNKSFEFWFEFHWRLFLMVDLKRNQHWFREWLGAELVRNHYLNQCWQSSLMHKCSTWGRSVNSEWHIHVSLN